MNSPELEKQLTEITWPQQRSADAVLAVCRQQKLLPENDAHSETPDVQNRAGSIESQAERLGVDALSVDASYRYIERELSNINAGLVTLNLAGETRFLAVVGASSNMLTGRRTLKAITPKGRQVKIHVDLIAKRLCEPLEAPLREDIANTLAQAKLNKKRFQNVSKSLLAERLGMARVEGIWLLRPLPDAALRTQLRFSGLFSKLLALGASYVAYYVLWVASWAVIGFGALNGHLDKGWIIAWVLTLLSLVPFRMAFMWQKGAVSIGIGTILRRRLLVGAMNLNPDDMRQEGIGQLLGRSLESSEFESLSLSGGINALVAVLELLIAAWVLSTGAGGALLVVLLLMYLLMMAFVFVLMSKGIRKWAHSRLRLTYAFVENMSGHRTRIAQEDPARWHEREDSLLNAYQDDSIAMDKIAIILALIPRGWLLLGLTGLAYAFTFTLPESLSLAIALGAVLLCYRAIVGLAGGMSELARASVAWDNLKPMLLARSDYSIPHSCVENFSASKAGSASDTAATTNTEAANFTAGGSVDGFERGVGVDNEEIGERVESVEVIHSGDSVGEIERFKGGEGVDEEVFNTLANKTEKTQTVSKNTLLEIHGITFAHRSRQAPVLSDCHLTIHSGDRLLLQGSSGSGKSTLASIISAVREPDAGLMLYKGLDLPSVGSSHWRKNIVMVPQFHDNHIFMGPFIFNLLMGRAWPPNEQDMDEVYEVCIALGLDKVLRKMPGGMMQLIGDTGWQLSHGEKSRVYIARALLQGADLLMFDESFAALDPENMQMAMNYVFHKAETLMVIAHP